ncbi:MAG: ABC transporter ATP-binding protein [Candidatus Bathyarchaeota archaeon]|nr:ABC transporter ATP-binding protein [Candidatus Bathyarchaeum tardum]WGM88857.1 MAG: ABC transporter ATP-binding protein [Candidatus Bathyarchaeum tardum]WNZ28901.1 MAG: ABC transporter ATP-binding protein [Candidatus Bathyarchaeota archaeon]
MKLEINNLSFSYNGNSVLNELNLNVRFGEVLGIVGPNGSGKSTLLKCMNRVLKTEQNTILIDGQDVSKIGLKELAKVMGYVPQSSKNVFPFTVFDVVLMGRRPYIQWSLGRNDKEIVAKILDYLGIGHLGMRYFNELSGGEQQKVIIARALAQQPEILLLDEPTSSLDIRHQLEILCILRTLAERKHCSVIISIHDLNLACRYSDRLLLLKDGSVFAVGTPETVMTEENIQAVYGIKSKVTKSIVGQPQVTPLQSETVNLENILPPKIMTKA